MFFLVELGVKVEFEIGIRGCVKLGVREIGIKLKWEVKLKLDR